MSSLVNAGGSTTMSTCWPPFLSVTVCDRIVPLALGGDAALDGAARGEHGEERDQATHGEPPACIGGVRQARGAGPRRW